MEVPMSEVVTTTKSAACEPAGRITRSLLGYGVIAGPFYVLVALGQALIRPGFDPLHDDVSLLSNGSLGWIQIANFVLTGAFVAAFAAGMARTGVSRWAPRLIAAYGVALIAAGIFVADPMNGFPAGAPAGRPDTITLHGMLHIVAAGIGFLCLIAACIVMARRFAAERRRGWAVYSVVTGAAFLVAFGAVASGSGSAIVVLGFWAALILVWSWMAAVAIHLYRRV
jgi:heme A synthase